MTITTLATLVAHAANALVYLASTSLAQVWDFVLPYVISAVISEIANACLRRPLRSIRTALIDRQGDR